MASIQVTWLEKIEEIFSIETLKISFYSWKTRNMLNTIDKDVENKNVKINYLDIRSTKPF